ncbi:hypothetical protein RGUI_0292 [Rhodovulum sp. P5]|uniref:hypothetical protein n=1 Tax=Rhodovulum sp. P5 TaxID=1564506 RepID=UPI0009C2424A|nr:hypothetical protein [Rhodovulum sp. P5]ARE38433.1 hypothetical protein RGUI_0292 [Rhodovulum sp. P5]
MEQFSPFLVAKMEVVAPEHGLALLIGFQTDQNADIGTRFSAERCENVPFALLHAALSCVPNAEYVVSPLFGEDFDAMDLAIELANVGYKGRYLVMTPFLPDPAIILCEIRANCPGVAVELIPASRH